MKGPRLPKSNKLPYLISPEISNSQRSQRSIIKKVLSKKDVSFENSDDEFNRFIVERGNQKEMIKRSLIDTDYNPDL